MSILYTGGTFDLFHAGHAAFLAQCRKLSREGEVVVSLNTDDFVTSYKGSPPVCNYREREAVLRACKFVDNVIPNRMGSDSRPVIEDIAPSIIAIGVDWAKKDYYAQMGFTQEWLDARNIMLVYVAHGFSTTLSTTDIKKRLGA